MRPALPTMMLLPLGTLLQNGHYRLEQLLEHRGWELTYEGTHLPSQKPVVLKTLNPSRRNPDEIARQRDAFLQQAQARLLLKHPHLEPIRDVFVESVLPFLVKDKIAGQTWATLGRKRPLSEAEAIAKITQIGSGLALVHQHHLLHGNIQPENVVVHPQTQHPMLVNMSWDFSATDLPLSLNPHAYAAPEQYQGRPTVATDIYGLAATLYTLLTGQVPIAASQRQHIRLDTQHPGLSQATAVVILRGMAIQPQHRPQSVAEWIDLLPQAHLEPALFSAESGNIGAVSPTLSEAPFSPASAPEDPASLEPSTSDSEEMVTAPSSDAITVPLQEQTQTVPSPHLQSYSIAPRFPIRALAICAILSGLVGIAFGLLLRFHYQNQFASPQVPAKKIPVKNEPFLPKSRPAERQLETFPPAETPETTIESPPPATLEEPALNPRYDQGGVETAPSLQETPPLAPDPLETDNPNLQTPLDPYPDRSDARPSPFDPFSTPDVTVPPPSESPPDYR